MDLPTCSSNLFRTNFKAANRAAFLFARSVSVRRDIHRNPPRLIARVGFDLYQRASVQFMLSFFMISFTYRCPRTGQNVHGHVVNDLIGSETYEPVTCTECGHTHLVNLKTGELLEEAEIVTR